MIHVKPDRSSLNSGGENDLTDLSLMRKCQKVATIELKSS
jgi:hypothetical protein